MKKKIMSATLTHDSLLFETNVMLRSNPQFFFSPGVDFSLFCIKYRSINRNIWKAREKIFDLISFSFRYNVLGPRLLRIEETVESSFFFMFIEKQRETHKETTINLSSRSSVSHLVCLKV